MARMPAVTSRTTKVTSGDDPGVVQTRAHTAESTPMLYWSPRASAALLRLSLELSACPISPPTFDRPPSDPVIREGLPPTFRMRADSHYVDSLDRFPAKNEPVAADTSGSSGDRAVAELNTLPSHARIVPEPAWPVGVAAREQRDAQPHPRREPTRRLFSAGRTRDARRCWSESQTCGDSRSGDPGPAGDRT